MKISGIESESGMSISVSILIQSIYRGDTCSYPSRRFPKSQGTCLLLMTFANSLDSDQARNILGLILIQNDCHSERRFSFEKVNFDNTNNRKQEKNIQNYPAYNELSIMDCEVKRVIGDSK